MVVNCAVPHCTNKWKKYRPLRFFRLPVQEVETLKQWLLVLNIDINTPSEKLYNVRVCGDHFSEDDYNKPVKNPTADISKCRLLKKTAVPNVSFSPGDSGSKILQSVDYTTKEEPPEDPAYLQMIRKLPREEMDVSLSSDDLINNYGSPEEMAEDKKKRKKKIKKKTYSSDEWEPAKESENSEEESDNFDSFENDGSMPVVCCEECGTEAKLQCSLLRHKKVFACPKCVHGNDNEAPCLEKLIIRFSDFKSFQVHAEKDHGVTTKRTLCQECGVFYLKPTDNGKKEHVCEYKTKHLVCSNCDRRFRTEKGLKGHMKKLHGNMVHPCKYCLMSFPNRLAKLEHEESHPKEEKPYHCPECSEKFRNIVKRNRHVRSHRGPWRFMCKTCGKGFPHLDRLERHELIHTGVKPFRCEVCKRSFSQEGHLKSHFRLHTGEKPYKCKFCEQCFNHNVSLKCHILRYHSSDTSQFKCSPKNTIPKPRRKPEGRPKGRPKRVLAKEGQENAESPELPNVKGGYDSCM